MEKVFEANVNITEYSSHVVQLFSYIFFLNKGKFLDVNASMIQHTHRFVHEFTKANFHKRNVHALVICIVAKFLKLIAFWTSSSSRNPNRTFYGKRIFSRSGSYCVLFNTRQ
jgi:hypothetical protein